ncbi:MAG: M67 family metallopeptidase [Acidobacteriia bacterium]|nr:M67 family metallopeptidase [Terriglobia bacterium]
MTLKVKAEQLEGIRQHARETYPNECCGALVGLADGNGDKEVREIVRLPNSFERETAAALGIDEDERGLRNRYVIDPRDLFETEKRARSRSLSIIGFYHSHPDHPAAPSKYDLRVASSGYSYVIVSVDQGQPKEVTCWETDVARERFESERLMEI